ncbi:UNVERIFIED_CONTAM: hypothetical protein K2H54_038702 [Gekko kuhli]
MNKQFQCNLMMGTFLSDGQYLFFKYFDSFFQSVLHSHIMNQSESVFQEFLQAHCSIFSHFIGMYLRNHCLKISQEIQLLLLDFGHIDLLCFMILNFLANIHLSSHL